MSKTNIKNLFRKLKSTLLYSGYEVILTGVPQSGVNKRGARHRAAKGYIVPDELKIFINRRIGVNDRVITLIHELMHEIYPDWQEPRVESESKKMFRGLTVPQLGFFQFFVMTNAEVQSALKRQQVHSPIC
ncbi:TPA: hypothetical protein DHW58_02535 [Patescibacteria group bacterium]|uniref:Uncharacterized protein n=1 Tax=candidate division Kazan bacterium GW2011_GWB1_52_7 TaxID=1620414 RepID=A0A0G2A4K2_UNCK3|nr:MAG: hypothetical protein VE99_C0001G0466 [candidate division Kazan bacterium GW2011_GWC1_52_13]KKW27159.1 MAG: hypothetical protein VF00_C0001G0094 [candidate division Kazan bacterium GW2011_GWB1_52_7]HCL47839.1 hypothetical protein [Patescibacteria group bacterium]HCR42447.1 hypothetical protein [Patescibacteria group bacterium]